MSCKHSDHGKFAALQKKDFVAAQGGGCFYCGQPFSKRNRPTRDHLFPRCMGRDLMFNKVMVHAKCNQAKGDRMPTAEEVERARVVYTILGLPSWKIG